MQHTTMQHLVVAKRLDVTPYIDEMSTNMKQIEFKNFGTYQ